MLKTKIIYSLKVHIQLSKLGFKYVAEMRNPTNSNLTCWAYEVTEEFEQALNEILGGMRND